MTTTYAKWPAGPQSDPLLVRSFELLRGKWGEIPATRNERAHSKGLASMSDIELLEFWQTARRDHTEGPGFRARGWYELLYKEALRGKRVLDLGCGLAYDTLFFASNGAHVTFADLAESNVETVRRLAGLMQLEHCDFLYMRDLDSLLQLQGDYDFVLCLGSMLNSPLWVLKLEAAVVLQHVPVGGRWIEFSYPEERWVREGRMPFERWGEVTDGGAPWVEWHNAAKVQEYLAPAQFEVVLDLDFHDADFQWVDLIRRA